MYEIRLSGARIHDCGLLKSYLSVDQTLIFNNVHIYLFITSLF